jgi:MFS family permease
MIGLLLAAYSFSGVLLCLPLGLASDRWRPRPIFIFGVLGTCLSAAILAISPSAAGIGFGRLVQGMASAAVWTSGMVIASEYFGPGRRSLAVASIFSAASLGELVSPVASGYLSERAGVATFFWIAAALAAGLALVLLIGKSSEQGAAQERKPVPSPQDQVDRRWAPLASSGALAFALFVAYTIILLAAPFKLARELDFGPAEIGVAFIGWNIVMIGAQIAAGRWAGARGSRGPLTTGLTVLVTGLALFGVFTTQAWMLSALYLSAAGVGLASTIATASISEAWERLRPAGTGLGTAFGVANTIWSLGFLTGNLVGGWVLTFVSMQSMLITMSIVLVPFLLGVLLVSRGRPPERDEAVLAHLPVDQRDG